MGDLNAPSNVDDSWWVFSISGLKTYKIHVNAKDRYWEGYKAGWQGYYNAGSAYWKKHTETTDKSIKIPALNKTSWDGSGTPIQTTWYTVDDAASSAGEHDPVIGSTSWGSVSKTSSLAAEVKATRRRACSAVLQSGKLYMFGVRCGNKSKAYYVET